MMDSTAITRELGARLRECRERIGLKAYEVASTLGWPASKVSRMETGCRLADPIDTAMYLGCCGVPQEIANPLLDLSREPDTGFWVRPHVGQGPDNLLTLIMNETAASTICNFEPIMVPGLLQTPAYAEGIMRGRVAVTLEDIEPLVDTRKARQRLLAQPKPPQAVFFVNEAALRCPVGGPKVMAEQLLHLVFITAKPQIKVRVIPNSIGAHAGMQGPFMLLHYLDRRPMTWLDSEVHSMLVEERTAVDTYRTIRTELHRIALDEQESREVFADLASEYERVASSADMTSDDLAQLG